MRRLRGKSEYLRVNLTRPSFILTGAAALLLLTTCASPDAGMTARAEEPVVVLIGSGLAPADLWSFETAAPALRAASCAAHDGAPAPFTQIGFAAAPLSPDQTGELAKRLPEGASLAGAWELTSDDPNFGGLSGLAAGEGGLLAVTDAGAWVSINLIEGKPSAAAIAYMRAEDGTFLSGKLQNDAEDVAWRGGVALVSFERDFRIEAFDLGGCGAAARAVRVASLPAEYASRQIPENSGPEALALTPEGHIRFGYEGASNSISPIGTIGADGSASWTGEEAFNPKGFALVSLAAAPLSTGGYRNIYLYRAFDPIRGARSVLAWGGGDQRISLSRPILTDNFEGLAAEVLPDGRLRLWIVSDNNFNKMQRNLLYAFDVTP